MALYEFTKSGTVKLVAVDGKELEFGGGRATRNLVAGEYSVQWFARGNEGEVFSITVGRPGQKPTKEKKDVFDASRKAAGTFWVEV